MKRRIITVLVVAMVALMAVGPAFAFTGVSGNLIDGNGDPWTHGGTVYAYSCDYLLTYIVGSPVGGGSFSIPWDVPPAPGTCVSVFVVFNDPPGDWPAPPLYNVEFNNAPIPGDYPLGNVSTGTGPNAIQLTEFSVTPQTSNNWLPFVLLVGSVALVGGAVTFIRKRR